MESANIAHELKCAKKISTPTVIRTYKALYPYTPYGPEHWQKALLWGGEVHLSSLAGVWASALYGLGGDTVHAALDVERTQRG